MCSAPLPVTGATASHRRHCQSPAFLQLAPLAYPLTPAQLLLPQSPGLRDSSSRVTCQATESQCPFCRTYIRVYR
jgi:hypothetical protein